MTNVRTSEGTSEMCNVCRICAHEMSSTPKHIGIAITAVKDTLKLTNYTIRIKSCINSSRNPLLLNLPSFILACISEKESYWDLWRTGKRVTETDGGRERELLRPMEDGKESYWDLWRTGRRVTETDGGRERELLRPMEDGKESYW